MTPITFEGYDLFCGAGGVTTGIHNAEYDGKKIARVIAAVNHDPLAIESHSENHDDVTHFTEDIRTLDVHKLPIVRNRENKAVFLWASLECFPAGTSILTTEGFIPIEAIKVGMKVLTHKNRWMPVTRLMSAMKPTVVIKGQGHPGLETTSEHPFYVRSQKKVWNNARRTYNYKVFSDPEWKTVSELTDCTNGKMKRWRWASPSAIGHLSIPAVGGRGMDMKSNLFWWTVGRWLGDGTIQLDDNHALLTITAGDHEKEDLLAKLSLFTPQTEIKRCGYNELRWFERRTKTAWLLVTAHKGLCEWMVEHFGKLAHGKKLPAWVYSLSRENRQSLLDGYVSADGHVAKYRTQCVSISKQLALGIRLLAESLGNRASLHYYEAHNFNIDGRDINSRPVWVVAWDNNKSQRNAFEEDGQVWSLIKEVNPGRALTKVYNLSVEKDESYVADGMVVHNCTNFSIAKGGLPRDEDSRTLAENLFPYIDQIKPDYIFIENVREFMAWGDLDENGKPVSRDRGRQYLKWVENVCKRGYTYDYRLLNSANYGAYTSRIRYFGVFAKDGYPIYFPQATHAKNPQNSIFGSMEKWQPVRDVLDLDDEGDSIFARKKPLVERTLKRILAGLEKYVAEDFAFLQSYYKNGQSLSINNPSPTLTTKDRVSKVSVKWLDKRYSGNHNHQPLNIPAASLTTVPKHALVSAQWLDKQYRSDKNHQSIEKPAGSLTANPKFALISANSFVMPTNYDNTPQDIDSPIGTITANRKWHYLVNPQYFNKGGSLDDPCFTLIARMDKKPPSIVTVIGGNLAIRIDESDSPTMRKIKFFMAAWGIVDICMRMLKISEMKRITGFSEDYVLMGTQADQKKFIGNAVPPIVPQRMFECLYEKLNTDNMEYRESV